MNKMFFRFEKLYDKEKENWYEKLEKIPFQFHQNLDSTQKKQYQKEKLTSWSTGLTE